VGEVHAVEVPMVTGAPKRHASAVLSVPIEIGGVA